MKKKLKGLIIPFIIASMALSGCGKKEAAEEEASLTPVQVQEMSQSSIKKELVYAGQVKANDTVNVTSKLSGQVESVKYDVGDYVNAGDVLFTLDKKDIQDQIKQLEASLKVSDASVSTAQTGLNQVSDGGQIKSSRLSLQSGVDNAQKAVDNTKKSVDNAKIQLDNAKSSLDDTQKKYNDNKKLFDAGVIARSDFDSIELGYTQAKNAYEQASNAYEQAKIGYDQAVDAYNTAKESLDIFDKKTTSDNVETAQNGVNTAVASRQSVLTQLEIAKSTLNDTSVKAPISGYITAKNISKTNMVSAQSAPYTIVDMSKVKVNVSVSEKVINLISVGKNVDVVIPTIGDTKLTGVIKTIAPSADSTNTYPVEIEIENSDSAIKAGMFAEIHFVESEADNAFVVPRNTILENDTDKYVYVVENNKAVKKVVETGIDNGENIQIVSGINNGDKVVVSGQDYVVDGEEVKTVTDDNNDNADNKADDKKDADNKDSKDKAKEE